MGEGSSKEKFPKSKGSEHDEGDSSDAETSPSKSGELDGGRENHVAFAKDSPGTDGYDSPIAEMRAEETSGLEETEENFVVDIERLRTDHRESSSNQSDSFDIAWLSSYSVPNLSRQLITRDEESIRKTKSKACKGNVELTPEMEKSIVFLPLDERDLDFSASSTNRSGFTEEESTSVHFKPPAGELVDVAPRRPTCGLDLRCSYKNFVFTIMVVLNLVIIISLTVPTSLAAQETYLELEESCQSSMNSVTNIAETSIANVSKSLGMMGGSELFEQLLYGVFFQPGHGANSAFNGMQYLYGLITDSFGVDAMTIGMYSQPFDPNNLTLDVLSWTLSVGPLLTSILKTGLYNETCRVFLCWASQYIDASIVRYPSNNSISTALTTVTELNTSGIDPSIAGDPISLLDYVAGLPMTNFSYVGGRFEVDQSTWLPHTTPYPDSVANSTETYALISMDEYHPIYRQYSLKTENISQPLVGLWSNISRYYDGEQLQFGFSWTWPWAPCGNYSCLIGVFGGVFTARQLSTYSNSLILQMCHSLDPVVAWLQSGFLIEEPDEDGLLQLRVNTTATSQANLALEGATLNKVAAYTVSFLVTLTDDFETSGRIMATSRDPTLVLNTSRVLPPYATDCTEIVIQNISKVLDRELEGPALLSNPNYTKPWQFLFHYQTLEICDTKDTAKIPECIFLAVSPLETPSITEFESLYNLRFLSVVAVPNVYLIGNFSQSIQASKDYVASEADSAEEQIQNATTIEAVLGAVFFLIGIGEAVLFSVTISRPLNRLRSSLRQLRTLDFRTEEKYSSRIKEIHEVESTFGALRNTLKVIEKFIPRTVVKQIVANENNARSLHVRSRVVTIMFSDLQGFTSIAEKLEPEELLQVLMVYFTMMSRIIEAYEGVVSEILGDGIMAFWNTPDYVRDHAAKACAAAIAMQSALKDLNAMFGSLFAKYGFKDLSMRVGIHTGQVLTGNIGSSDKFKWGCIGDPCNLASRLEGICKLYKVGILCSADTHAQLPESVFLCRELDLVRVKGKAHPTQLFEVYAIQSSFSCARSALFKNSKIENAQEVKVTVLSNFHPSSDPDLVLKKRDFALYETSLHLFQKGEFETAKGTLSLLPELDPASSFLLERIEQALGRSAEQMEEKEWDGVLNLMEKSF